MTPQRDDRGFALIELMVTMALAIVVLSAVLLTADLFQSNTAANSRVTEAQDRARTQIDTMVRTIRDAPPTGTPATPIIYTGYPTSNDIVLSSATGQTRYCVGGDNGAATGSTELRIGTHTGAYSAPGSGCPAATTAGWSYATVVKGLRMSGTQTVFNLSCTAPANGTCATSNINAIGITLTMQTTGTHTTTLGSAVDLRND